jgi:hypothetical protein
MPAVNLNGKTVSDLNVQTVLQRIADLLGATVKVTSGDRGHVPTGGSTTSHHLSHTAADIHVEGLSDDHVFARLMSDKDTIFDADKRYQVIKHGQFTATQGAHIHIGRYADGTGVAFFVEGTMAPMRPGKYQSVR